MNVFILVLLLATSPFTYILAIDDIPSKFISTKPYKSLFCNTCAVLSSIVNETLYDNSKDFESLVGFRLDSTGKKIRKQSGWLKLFLSLEDVCEDWKDKYRVAKRKNENLYLIENEMVRAMADIERKRKEKLEKEASDRLNKQWDKEWEIEVLKQETLWNKTHNENGDLIDENGNIIDEDGDIIDENGDIIDENNATKNDTNDQQNPEKIDDKSDGESDDEKDNNDDDDTPTPRYFHEKKPKLVKRKSKQQKIIKDICYFLSEKFDEWLHVKQKEIPKKMKEGDELKDTLKPMWFCLEDKICDLEMFDIAPKIYKFKKELRLPKKPKRTWTPPNKRNIDQKDQYDEQMEDDIDDNINETVDGNIDQNATENNGDINDENQGEMNDENEGNKNDNNDINNDEKPKSEL